MQKGFRTSAENAMRVLEPQQRMRKGSRISAENAKGF